MKQKPCWLCSRELTKTREHVIPEKMGGKKTVQGFICRDCNSTTGHGWDAALIEFESWKFHMDPNLRINPQRDRLFRARLAETDTNVYIDPGAKVRLGRNAPTTKKGESGEEVIHFAADPSDVDDLFRSVNTTGQRRGMSPLTREEFDARIERDEIPQPRVNFTLKLQIPKYYRSIVKTAMSMAFSLGVSPLDCENAVRYLRDETLAEEGVVYVPGTSLEEVLEDWIDYHAVTILGLPGDRKLIGEVLYFGNVAGLVLLSDSYDGPSIIAGHSINLRNGEYEDADLNLRHLPELYLPADGVVNLVSSRIKQFKSPMVLEILGDLDRIVGEFQ